MSGPLSGFRVVDASAVVSGPLAGMILADQGAEVIKVETRELGDVTRLPFNMRGGMTGLFANCNRGKRSIVFDVREPEGRQIMLDLVAEADVFIQNWRPGAAERLGLGEADLRAVNERLIYASVSGYGDSGPYADQRVYDPVIQAYSGMVHSQRPGEEARCDLVRNIVADKVSSYTLCQAITAALLARERGAGGQHLHVPMLDATVAFFWPDGMMHKTLLGEGVDLPLQLSDIYRVYPTKDGHVVAFAQSPAEMEGLARALDREDWLEEPGFTNVTTHMADFDAFLSRIESAVANFTTEEVVARFSEHEVPVAPVLDHEEMLADAQVQHNETVLHREHPTFGAYQQPRQPTRFSATPTEPAGHPPLQGEHTAEVLEELGYGASDIEALKRKGVID